MNYMDWAGYFLDCDMADEEKLTLVQMERFMGYFKSGCSLQGICNRKKILALFLGRNVQTIKKKTKKKPEMLRSLLPKLISKLIFLL